MEILALSNHPGCCGSPSAITPGQGVCQTCPSFSYCLSQAKITLSNIESQLVVKVARQTRTKLKKGEAFISREENPDGVEQAIEEPVESPPTRSYSRIPTGRLPKKSEELLRRLDRFDFDIHSELTNGTNPFKHLRPAFLEVIGDMLLKEGFTKRALSNELVSRLDWRDQTAMSHVSFSIPALSFIGVIKEQNGHFTLGGNE